MTYSITGTSDLLEASATPAHSASSPRLDASFSRATASGADSLAQRMLESLADASSAAKLGDTSALHLARILMPGSTSATGNDPGPDNDEDDPSLSLIGPMASAPQFSDFIEAQQTLAAGTLKTGAVTSVVKKLVTVVNDTLNK